MIQRRGFSLIEMLLTMTVGSALMVLAMTLLQQAMSLSSQTQKQCDSDRTTHQLCEQFRRDAHSASTVITNDHAETIFIVDFESVLYRVLDGTVIRTRPTQQEYERYKLGESASVTIEPLDPPTRISLTVRRQPSLKHVGPRTDRQVTVSVGRFTRTTPDETSADEKIATRETQR